ncbi:hypothetical protein RHGRI_018733 [Rhododendron griersonianum]|uniref:Aconitase A/isopropylmalate dehydratase small subunit swivel domain-containing protein n=1 Tax=Rhododendron griersonianum TaxID=479676 RepID=A0AAV6K2I4_9ERIC|nr:hypothetical protein RHGRI_018733 [Rhododendron griersonianum]
MSLFCIMESDTIAENPLTRANYLALPPLVVAYALAGMEPIGTAKNGKDVYFKDIWPSNEEVAESPFFKSLCLGSKDVTVAPPGPRGVKDAYCIPDFGDGITTDHISPAGSIHKDSPAAKCCGNDEVMVRGTFANIRLVNKLLNGEVGPKTIHIPTGEKLSVFGAPMRYKVVAHDLAGAKYGSGSSRDWAAN